MTRSPAKEGPRPLSYDEADEVMARLVDDGAITGKMARRLLDGFRSSPPQAPVPENIREAIEAYVEAHEDEHCWFDSELYKAEDVKAARARYHATTEATYAALTDAIRAALAERDAQIQERDEDYVRVVQKQVAAESALAAMRGERDRARNLLVGAAQPEHKLPPFLQTAIREWLSANPLVAEESHGQDSAAC